MNEKNNYEELGTKWKSIERRDERIEYGFKILPEIIEKFVQAQSDKLDDIDLCIASIGMHDPTPAILIWHLLKPRMFFLLSTKATQNSLKKFGEHLQLDDTRKRIIDVNPYDCNNIYKLIKDRIENLPFQPVKIHVDITGGTAYQTVSLTKVAGAFNGTVSYIKADRDDKTGLPTPFTQKFLLIKDPLDFVARQEFNKAHTFFRNHLYHSASALINETLKNNRVPRGSEAGRKLDIRRAICEMYQKWEEFALKEALDLCSRTIRMIENTDANYADLKTNLARHKKALDSMKILMGQTPAMEILKNDRVVSYLLMHLFETALRRGNAKLYNSAILHFYRMLELVSQYRLATYNFDTDQPDYSIMDGRFEGWREHYEKQTRKLDLSADLPDKVALINGYCILKSLGDPLKVDLRQLKDITTIRNKMIMEHGFQRMTQSSYNRFKALSESILKKLFETAGWSFSEISKDVKFMDELPSI